MFGLLKMSVSSMSRIMRWLKEVLYLRFHHLIHIYSIIFIRPFFVFFSDNQCLDVVPVFRV